MHLANSSSITSQNEELRQKFWVPYRRKAHVHHYTQYMEPGLFDIADEHLSGEAPSLN